MKSVVSILATIIVTAGANAQTVIYEQPHANNGTIYHSSWWDPDGSPYDAYVWDGFILASDTAVTEIHWRGGFDPAYFGSGGPVLKFTIEIWSSIQPGQSQPDIGSVFAPNPMRHYVVTGNCNQTPAGSFGGVAMYDYRYTLPTAFQAVAGMKYWVKINAWQHGVCDWGLAAGTGGDGYYFRKLQDYSYQTVSGDAAFSAWTQAGTTYNIAASTFPAGAGTIAGTGAYPAGSAASLSATANAGFGFVNWTENGTQVSASNPYNFTVTANRTLVANFTNAYTITTAVSPTLGGFTTGDGIYNNGASVTVTATANAGYAFTEWTESGTPVSTSASYTFPAASNRTLVANFAPLGSTILFDIDNAPVHTSLPVDLTVSGLTAHFSATAQGFSIQQANTMGFTPAGFAGLCIYPNSVFAADLLVSFSQTLTDFSIMYSPQELGCDTSATMRVTAFMGGAQVGTNTATAPVPGTWPTGTLSITVPGGFNSVVVHYDSRPPTCQDYGVIFLADNMLVTLACGSPTMTQQPTSDSTCSIGGTSFNAAATGTLPLQHTWQAELDPGVWTDMTDGNLIHNGIVIGFVSGAATEWMQISGLTQFLTDRTSLNVRCAVSNVCGSSSSNAATLTVWPTGTGDANGDGVIDARDIQAFIDFIMVGWSPAAGWCASDLDMDGWVDDTEVPGMVALLLGP
jgi:hypothetical protein